MQNTFTFTFIDKVNTINYCVVERKKYFSYSMIFFNINENYLKKKDFLSKKMF